ncbi:NAD-dependent succinate-semialdehyde dehydrogenase [Streptosporangium sp. CA-115845]|uniref:NAD-dependent succinate-semialdehyde dehydrogenase n=1 Tax=Streptosporangium sp. CA-115845 TaxID=3240071 RepID=UPI003D8F0A56
MTQNFQAKRHDGKPMTSGYWSELFIGGRWVAHADSGKKFDVTDPATGTTISSLPDGGREEMRQAVEAAADAQSEWAHTTADHRAEILRAAARLMLERIEHLATTITLEQGKPLAEARGEIRYSASFLEWFAEEGRRVYGRTIPSSDPAKRLLVLKTPIGVSSAITPWNFPSAMITRKVGPALAAGCCMVVKPSELTPLSALELAGVFEEVGLPTGVLSIVAGLDAAAIIEPVMSDPRVRKLSFTGSTAVGKKLMSAAVGTMKRLSLELGGHAPFIVFDDADLDAAVDAAVASKMRNMGQTCVAANRFYIQRGISDEFGRRLAERMNSLTVGYGLQEGVDVGPLVSSSALRKVETHVADARSKGAALLTGGRRLAVESGARADASNFFAPTVLSQVDERMQITQEETFGPVAALLTFDSEDEVVSRANNTPYGLAAYYFTRDVGRVLRLAEQLQYGILGANDGMPSTAQAPFGGIKESGYGREGGAEGISEYLDTKFVSLGSVTRSR